MKLSVPQMKLQIDKWLDKIIIIRTINGSKYKGKLITNMFPFIKLEIGNLDSEFWFNLNNVIILEIE